MDKVLLALKSRTVWTVVAMVIINGIASVQDMIPANYLPAINLLVGALAVYFRVNPKA